MKLTTVQELFQHELGDIYDAEHRFLEVQQKMLQAASAETLRAGIEKHIEETQEQIAQLQRIFELLQVEAKRDTCDASKGIVTEYEKGIEEVDDPQLLDVLISNSATKAEHYEISTYRGLIVHSDQIGLEEISLLLRQNLQQEETAAAKLEENSPMLIKLAIRDEQ